MSFIEMQCPACNGDAIDYSTGDCPCCRHAIMSCYCRQCGHMFLAALGYAHASLSESESLGDNGPSL